MNRRLIAIFFVAPLAAGCMKPPPQAAPAEPPTVPVAQPVQRDVTDFVDFTGRMGAVNSVEVRARVTGYITRMPFTEGSEVKKGDLLFEIDPRPYQAQLEQAQGQINLYKAQLKLAQATLARYQASGPAAVSKQELEQNQASVEEAEARIKAAEASMKVYELNLAFTKVTSPISGQVSRYYLTVGNLVNQDQTLLTTIVSLDPVYAYFDMDEPTLLRIRRAINEGRIKPPQPGADIPVFLGVQGEEDYPHKGTLNFVNNQINPTTGSILVRAVFPNPKPENGRRILAPGMFARIHLPIGQPHPAVLVIDRAIQSDQGLKYVYVVDDQNTVQYRRVTVGALQEDGLRVVAAGLKPTERIVVGGLQQVRPRTTIQPEAVPMPTLGPSEADSGKQADPETGRQGNQETRKPGHQQSGGTK